jgi:hypothetical protein
MFDLEYYNMITDYGKICVKIDTHYKDHLKNLNDMKYTSKFLYDKHLNIKQSLFFENDAMVLAVGKDYVDWYYNYY